MGPPQTSILYFTVQVRSSRKCQAVVIFVFSSRRRHTRSDRDWSSDVCSSDLVPSRADATVRDRRSQRPLPGSHGSYVADAVAGGAADGRRGRGPGAAPGRDREHDPEGRRPHAGARDPPQARRTGGGGRRDPEPTGRAQGAAGAWRGEPVLTGPPIDFDALREDLSGLTQEPAAPRPRKQSQPIDLVALAEDLKGAHPATAPPLPASPSVSPARGRQFPDISPRYDRLGEPMNEAARDIETARGGVATDTSSTAERARRFGQGAVLSMGLPFQPLSPEEARAPATQAAATRYGPAAVQRVQRLAAQPGTPAGDRPSLARRLFEASPLGIVPGLLRREPEAYGGLAGMVLQGEVLRPGPGTALVRGAEGEVGAAAAFRTLGLDPRTATEADVMAAAREAAQRTHPDVAPADRVARGGPADPIVAPQEFNAAMEARAAPPAALGRGPPAPRVPAPRAAETQVPAR